MGGGAAWRERRGGGRGRGYERGRESVGRAVEPQERGDGGLVRRGIRGVAGGDAVVGGGTERGDGVG